MSEPFPSGAPANPPSPAGLHELAQLLRAADHLGPQAQTALADLMDELSQALPAGAPLTGDKAHLADSTAHLIHALHQRKDAGFLSAAKQRLNQAAIRAEAEAPLAAGIVRRVIDALANVGI